MLQQENKTNKGRGAELCHTWTFTARAYSTIVDLFKVKNQHCSDMMHFSNETKS